MDIEDLKNTHSNIYNSAKRSDEVLEEVRGQLGEGDTQFCVIANGSLARKELTSGSDFDAYAVFKEPLTSVEADARLADIKQKTELRTAAVDGNFDGDSTNYAEILQNIGGNDDDNKKLTRRILLILESTPITGAGLYDNLVQEIVERYISETITDHQLGMFLLNDIIRFYRTMCVDYEYKVVEGGKPWGIRNIKLVFSRKLMYFSGVMMCAELAQRTPSQKREILERLIKKTPVERLLGVVGGDALPVLDDYDFFLGVLDDENKRKHLETLDQAQRKDEQFRELKNAGHHFSWKLAALLAKAYGPSHPIHKAVLL